MFTTIKTFLTTLFDRQAIPNKFSEIKDATYKFFTEQIDRCGKRIY